MRRLFSALLALGMVMAGLMGVSAQDSASSYATGLNAPATWTDERGSVVATIEVTDVNLEWTDYNEYSSPDTNSIFRSVSFTVSNVSDANMIVEPYDFSMVDEFGRNQGRAWVTPSEEAEGSIFDEDLALAAGESADLTLVFQTLEIAAPDSLVWQPDSGVLIIIGELAEGSGQDAAVVSGIGSESSWTDDRGNLVATLEVTEIEDDWQDYGEYNEPSRGMVYRAVHLKFTNASGSSLIIEPFSLSMVDSTGKNNGRSWAQAAEDADVALLSDDVPLADGEVFEGILVFEMYPDITPNVILWQPDSGVLNMVVLADGTVTTVDTDATPTETEEEEDVPASPEAEEESEEAIDLDDLDKLATSRDAGEDEEEAGVDAESEAEVGTDEDESGAATVDATGVGEETEINSEAQPILDVVGDEVGTAQVVSTTSGWEGYNETANAPIRGTHFYLVTVEVDITHPNGLPMSPLDFTVVTESGEEYQGDLYLQNEDADPQITDRGSVLPEGATTLVISFMIPEDEVPVMVIWNTGPTIVELSLEP